MRSDNQEQSMRLNRFIAKPWVIPIILFCYDLFVFLGVTYIINVSTKIVDMFKDKDNAISYLGTENLVPHIFTQGSVVKFIYLVLLIFLIVTNAKFAYDIRTSFADKGINQGQHGTRRWTTQKEIKKQFKKIPMVKEEYTGSGGCLMSRIGKYFYIDPSPVNSAYLGTTRSGKGEAFVFSLIDLLSRANKKQSLVVNDQKLELYSSSKKTLEKRGFIVKLLNLDDPIHSFGYNPLQLVKVYYKDGEVAKAQMAARSFAFAIFHADEAQEGIWKNTATDLFTALIIAITSDCIEADKKVNKKRYAAYRQKREFYDNLTDDEKKIADERWQSLRESLADSDGVIDEIALIDELSAIPKEQEFVESCENEKGINCFSVINFFREMCDRGKGEAQSMADFEKKAENALDVYFNARGNLDYAAGLYSEIKNAGDRTKGSVYINMLSALSIFSLETIAKLTAENDIDFLDVAYGDKPYAIFLGIPFEDKSNHFLATTFITQLIMVLVAAAKKSGGKLPRKVKFILDEFGNLPPIENFSGFLTAGLGIGVSFDLFLQSYNQVKEKYGDEYVTIMDNCANQRFIMAAGTESAEEFSNMLGKKTIIDVQRTGGKLSTDKSYMESTKERPLMDENELTMLKEGESVITRVMKRTDILGVAIESMPIINEYADMPILPVRMYIFIKTFVKRRINGKMPHPDKDFERDTTLFEQYRIDLNYFMRYHGTAFLYRYQYLSDDFPDPDSVELYGPNGVCDESRAHIHYEEYIRDPNDVIELLKKGENIIENKTKTLGELSYSDRIEENLYKAFGGPEEIIKRGINEKISPAELTELVTREVTDAAIKDAILADIKRG